MRTRLGIISAALITVWVLAFALPANAFKHQNSPENLKALFEAIHKATSTGDGQTAAKLSGPLFPDEKSLRQALREDVPQETVDAILALHKKYLGSIPIEEIFVADPANKEVKVHGAKTEDIALNKKGTIVFQEFPGGAVRLAKTILRPGVIFYEVELVKPGSERGMKYHLFYWDGSGWSMIGPAWRALR